MGTRVPLITGVPPKMSGSEIRYFPIGLFASYRAVGKKSIFLRLKPSLANFDHSYQKGIAYNGSTYEGNGRGKKESRLGRLLKSRTLCIKTMCSRGITEVIYLTAYSVSHCPWLSRHSLAGVQLSTNGTCSFLWQEGAQCTLFFSPPDTSR